VAGIQEYIKLLNKDFPVNTTELSTFLLSIDFAPIFCGSNFMHFLVIYIIWNRINLRMTWNWIFMMHS